MSLRYIPCRKGICLNHSRGLEANAGFSVYPHSIPSCLSLMATLNLSSKRDNSLIKSVIALVKASWGLYSGVVWTRITILCSRGWGTLYPANSTWGSFNSCDLMIFPMVWSSLFIVNRQALGTFVSLVIVILRREEKIKNKKDICDLFKTHQAKGLTVLGPAGAAAAPSTHPYTTNGPSICWNATFDNSNVQETEKGTQASTLLGCGKTLSEKTGFQS